MFWDRIAGVYDLFETFVNRKTCNELKKVMAALIQPDDEVLECACGTGLLTGIMAEGCKRLTAMDLSPKMLEKAQRKCGQYDHVTFQRGDILALDFPDESFDVVAAANVIHLLDEPCRALEEMRRVCRKGGRIIVPTYLNQYAEVQPNILARLVKRTGTVCRIFKRHFTQQSYRRFFEDAGYVLEEYLVAQGRIPCAVAVMVKK